LAQPAKRRRRLSAIVVGLRTLIATALFFGLFLFLSCHEEKKAQVERYQFDSAGFSEAQLDLAVARLEERGAADLGFGWFHVLHLTKSSPSEALGQHVNLGTLYPRSVFKQTRILAAGTVHGQSFNDLSWSTRVTSMVNLIPYIDGTTMKRESIASSVPTVAGTISSSSPSARTESC